MSTDSSTPGPAPSSRRGQVLRILVPVVIIGAIASGLSASHGGSGWLWKGTALVCLLTLGLAGLRWRAKWYWKAAALLALPLLAVAAFSVRSHFRYATADSMTISIREFTHAEYPEDPADRSLHHQQYDGRRLVLNRLDDTHFDFVFEPLAGRDDVAQVVFRNVDVSQMTPSVPEWTKSDPGLLRIALTDRQWNRQQVAFPMESIEVTGGDGFEVANLASAELAKNCLNAGLWELLLFTKEDGQKKLYYQGWFTFPLGHYQRLFEQNTGLRFNDHWYYLEHWFDPAGTPVPVENLRTVLSEQQVSATFETQEPLFASGEQARKRRTTVAPHVTCWEDFYDGSHTVRFASFIPPGRYSLQHPWKNEYPQMAKFESATLRRVRSASPKLADKELHELELVFRGGPDRSLKRFFVSGFEWDKLPQLAVSDYPKGLYMPMGIGVPPFFQSSADLQAQPPQDSPYFSVLLDASGRWIDHHQFAIDGPVLHRDADDPTKLHLYLLSYERHSLIAHVVIPTTPGENATGP